MDTLIVTKKMDTLIVMKCMSGENLVITFERFTKSNML